MTPTYYTDEIKFENHEGYRVLFSAAERGSIVNERTLLNYYTQDQEYNGQFAVNL